MNDLISRSGLGVDFCNPDVFENKAYAEGWNSLIKIIKEAPAVNAEPVRHGRWILNKHYGDYECSECGKGDFTVLDFKKHNMKYCPNCGANMDAEVE